jgi:hypothetical protein
MDRINRRQAQVLDHNGFLLDGFDRFLGWVKWRAKISLLVFLLSIQLRFSCQAGALAKSWAYLTSHAKPRRAEGRSLVSEDIVLHF